MLLDLLLKLLLVLSVANAGLRLAETIQPRLLNNTEAVDILMLIATSLPAQTEVEAAETEVEAAETEVESMRGLEVVSRKRKEAEM